MEITMNQLGLSDGDENLQRVRMKQAVAYLQNYMETYTQQPGWENYSDSMFLDDVLYGLGVALNESYKFAPGFARFKAYLREYLET